MEQNTQTDQHPKTQYCLLLMRYKFLSSDVKIKLDMGEDVGLLKHFDQDVLEKTSKVTAFVSRIDGLNYMSLLGWEVVHQLPFETDSDGGTYQTTRYLMKRTV